MDGTIEHRAYPDERNRRMGSTFIRRWPSQHVACGQCGDDAIASYSFIWRRLRNGHGLLARSSRFECRGARSVGTLKTLSSKPRICVRTRSTRVSVPSPASRTPSASETIAPPTTAPHRRHIAARTSPCKARRAGGEIGTGLHHAGAVDAVTRPDMQRSLRGQHRTGFLLQRTDIWVNPLSSTEYIEINDKYLARPFVQPPGQAPPTLTLDSNVGQHCFVELRRQAAGCGQAAFADPRLAQRAVKRGRRMRSGDGVGFETVLVHTASFVGKVKP
ncbi:MAG: hypothetical protein E5299_01131 [Burkholderia gladioli]|nr:MAG: hypothetical protein E5299_01131 [Burkholderia gladioli]